MSDEAGLLEAIRHQPNDDVPRLIFADWLEDHGDADRAEFIRVQIEAERHASGSSEFERLCGRAAELLRTHKETWIEGYEAALTSTDELTVRTPASAHERGVILSRIVFSRGFIEEIYFEPETYFSLSESAFRPSGPLPSFRLQVHNRYDAEFGALEHYLQPLASSPMLKWCRDLHIHGGFSATTDEGLIGLSESPALLAKIGGLHFSEDRITNQGLLPILESPHLVKLRELVIDYTPCTEAVLRPLLQSLRFRGMTLLWLSGCIEGARGIRQFATPGKWPKLRMLYLDECGLTGLTLRGLMRPGTFPTLEFLALGGNDIYSSDVCDLLASSAVPQLRGLGLNGTRLTLEEVEELRKEYAGINFWYPVPRSRQQPPAE